MSIVRVNNEISVLLCAGEPLNSDLISAIRAAPLLQSHTGQTSCLLKVLGAFNAYERRQRSSSRAALPRTTFQSPHVPFSNENGGGQGAALTGLSSRIQARSRYSA